MANTIHNSPLAVTYAESLLQLGWEQKTAVDIGHELQALGTILQAEPAFRDYLADPGIGQEERSGALERIFRGRVSELVYNFLGVLNSHGRVRLLDEIISAYDVLLDQRIGNVEVDVTSAQPLGLDEVEQVRDRVSKAINKNAIIHQFVDESIIGGLVIRVGDRVIDASVKQQLASMRQQFLSASRKVRG